jgi:hypothetical protein
MYHKGSVDIIGMLVDIYGSTDLFLNEYRSLLSEKLLSLTSYQIGVYVCVCVCVCVGGGGGVILRNCCR